jgi:hypothetical protein
VTRLETKSARGGPTLRFHRSATQKENPGRFDRIKIAQIHSIKLPDPFGTQSTSQAVLEKT